MKKSFRTRKKIMKASEKLFMVKSISRVTIEEITDQAGVSKGTFYLYFDSKETLVWDYIEEKLTDLNLKLKSLDIDNFNEESISQIISWLVSYIKKHRIILKLMHHVEFFSFLGSKRMKEKHINKWVELITLWLERGKKKGKLSLSDSRFISYFLVISIHEILEKVLLNELPFTFSEVEKEIKTVVLKILK